jgi:16S rRNA (cytosine1402-N4)-methyltransferase
MHIPVLLQEILDTFSEKKLTLFFDGTLGGAGHAEALLKAHPECQRYLATDQDSDAIQEAKKKLDPWKEKVKIFMANFSEIDHVMRKEKIKQLDGAMLDLGVSSFQLDRPEKGFSFNKEGPLDMRMGQDNELTAERVVNEYTEKQLGEILRTFGEDPRWRKIAKAICEKRRKKRITTTKELKEIIERVYPKRGRIHPATLTFQALRMFVNQELEHLEKGLNKIISHLAPGARLAVISFHSGEDRCVKQLFKKKYADKVVTLVNKKVIKPTIAEIRKNRRSRSAKMRVVEKCVA